MERACSPVAGFEVATFYRAALDVRESHDPLIIGGDLYEVAWLGPHTAALAVGDVCGHGPVAATRAVQIKSALQAIWHQERNPAPVLTRLNEFLTRCPYGPPSPGVGEGTNDWDRFTALCLAVADGYTGEVRVAGAGIEGALILRRQAGIDVIPGDGFVVGMLPGRTYEEVNFNLDPGDLLVLMTDGMTEARNAAGEVFGIKRIQAVLEEMRGFWGDPYVLGQQVMNRVWEFCGARATDDMCVLIARRLAPST